MAWDISSRAHCETKSSHTLATCDVKDMGLSLEIVVGVSFGIGATLASFQTFCGTLPSQSEELKISVTLTGVLNSQANSFTSLLGRSSGQVIF